MKAAAIQAVAFAAFVLLAGIVLAEAAQDSSPKQMPPEVPNTRLDLMSAEYREREQHLMKQERERNAATRAALQQCGDTRYMENGIGDFILYYRTPQFQLLLKPSGGMGKVGTARASS